MAEIFDLKNVNVLNVYLNVLINAHLNINLHILLKGQILINFHTNECSSKYYGCCECIEMSIYESLYLDVKGAFKYYVILLGGGGE